MYDCLEQFRTAQKKYWKGDEGYRNKNQGHYVHNE